MTEKTIDVKKFINHESFKYNETKSYAHDICILELSEEVDLQTYTPACLAKSSDATTWDGKSALVYGNLESVVSMSSPQFRLGLHFLRRRVFQRTARGLCSRGQ